MKRSRIQEELFRRQDTAYREFQSKLIPTVAAERVIGVRTPELRRYAKQLLREGGAEEFLKKLPHRYFEENQLHAFLLAEEKDYDKCIAGVREFLPYIDNWATCDQLLPKVFQKHREELLVEIRRWLVSTHTYEVRFAVGMLMQHYLEEDYDAEYPALVAALRSEEYYIRMMAAWYFATALAKRYDEILPYLEEQRLEPWTHNKAIQKAIESYRITTEQKAYLRSLRIRRKS